jgi:hypothetical protein
MQMLSIAICQGAAAVAKETGGVCGRALARKGSHGRAAGHSHSQGVCGGALPADTYWQEEHPPVGDERRATGTLN